MIEVLELRRSHGKDPPRKPVRDRAPFSTCTVAGWPIDHTWRVSSYEYQLAMWPAQRDQRAQLDDVLSAPHDVEHFAYFKRRANADAAAEALIAEGFKVGLGRRGFKTVLQAVRKEPLTDEAVAEFLRDVIKLVEQHDGDYDGWGAAVEAEASSSAS
ncbi:ribonuclease E inhibitor RraB [Micromonospora sp. DT81.3]|uniref:ribonuclease E inhibitor RraB n=1 Tax=Micromonospora sp. DT81.3 TaxID=3416523 RepID=UPI003CF890F3